MSYERFTPTKQSSVINNLALPIAFKILIYGLMLMKLFHIDKFEKILLTYSMMFGYLSL